jgi:hypothetical protein
MAGNDDCGMRRGWDSVVVGEGCWLLAIWLLAFGDWFIVL